MTNITKDIPHKAKTTIYNAIGGASLISETAIKTTIKRASNDIIAMVIEKTVLNIFFSWSKSHLGSSPDSLPEVLYDRHDHIVLLDSGQGIPLLNTHHLDISLNDHVHHLFHFLVPPLFRCLIIPCAYTFVNTFSKIFYPFFYSSGFALARHLSRSRQTVMTTFPLI